MSKLAWIVTLAVFSVTPAAAESAIPNLLGTWKGESESIVMGPGNAHHSAAPAASLGRDLARSTVKAPVNSPDAMGL